MESGWLIALCLHHAKYPRSTGPLKGLDPIYAEVGNQEGDTSFANRANPAVHPAQARGDSALPLGTPADFGFAPVYL